MDKPKNEKIEDMLVALVLCFIHSPREFDVRVDEVLKELKRKEK